MKNSFFLAILLVFAICSCKSTTLGPNAETATIKGQASIAANYAQYTPPYNGITVSLIGTSFSAMTDDSGNFEIDNVPSGTYDVRFSKPGYGDVLWFGKIVMGGGNASINWKTENDDPYVRYPTLYKQPNLALHLESASFTDTTIKGYSTSNALVEKGHYSGATPMSYGGIVSYVSRKSNVSSIPGHYNSFFYHYYPGEEELYDTNSHIFLEPIDVSTLRDIGFNSGDSIYIAVYGAPIYGGPMTEYGTQNESLNGYFDPNFDQYVLTSINQTPSPVIGLKIP